MKRIMLALGFIAALGTAIPLSLKVSKWAAGTPALAARISLVEERLDNKILRDRRDALQERLWKLEDRHAEKFWTDKGRAHEDIDELVAWMDKDSRDQWRRLVAQLEEVENELDRRAKENDDG